MLILFAKGRSARVPVLSAVKTALLLTVILSTGLRGQTSRIRTPEKRAITPADGLEMTRLEAPDYSAPDFEIAHFSPDGTQFVIVLRKGNLEMDTNDFSLLLYQTAKAFHSTQPNVLLRMRSSSNRGAITKVRWLSDNETVIFLGENPNEFSQIYSFNVRSNVLKKLTHQPAAITNYDITEDGRRVVFVADPPERNSSELEQGSKEIVVTKQSLVEILTGEYSQAEEMFFQTGSETPQRVPLAPGCAPGRTISLSPDGRYVVFAAAVTDIPPAWVDYEIPILKQIIGTNVRKGATPIQQYLVFDSKEKSLRRLINAPIFGSDPISWAPEGNTVRLTSYLPLDVTDISERKAREQTKFPIEVKLPGGEYQRVLKEVSPRGSLRSSPINVILKQDCNTPPKVYVTDTNNQHENLLFVLNPEFDELEFGVVKTIQWKVDGVELIAGLYLPPDYTPGKRYPLVIQTHGFEPTEFSMDGRSEWSGAFAARPLAAKGVVVLQYAHYKDHSQIDRVVNNKKLGATVGEWILNFHMHALEAVVDQLDKESLIDRDRVGLSGFSRWACFAGYILTHSKQRFVSASLVDGISCGYFEEVAVPEEAFDFDDLMGGATPFGEGLKAWMKNSPGFNLDKVETAVQLAAFGKYSILSAWEWYVGLTLQRKPVDLTYMPQAIHIGVKPSERMSSQQRIVDWFSFWLQEKEDSDLAKLEQYVRWRGLRTEYQATSPDASFK